MLFYIVFVQGIFLLALLPVFTWKDVSEVLTISVRLLIM